MMLITICLGGNALNIGKAWQEELEGGFISGTQPINVKENGEIWCGILM